MVRPLLVNLVINDGRRDCIVVRLAEHPSRDGDRLVKESQVSNPSLSDYYWACKCDEDFIHARWLSGSCRQCGLASGCSRLVSQDQVVKALTDSRRLRKQLRDYFAEAN